MGLKLKIFKWWFYSIVILHLTYRLVELTLWL